MRVILYGATGMIGQGVLRECLLAPDVTAVLAVGRAPTGQRHEKLRELVRADLFDVEPIVGELAAHDACFWCLGVSSAGMSEADYARITHDLTLAVAGPLARANPDVTFVFVSGAGADATERGRTMWARVKGRTENAVLALPFRAAYVFRPAFVRPLHGIVSRTRFYNALYRVLSPLVPLVMRFPSIATTTERLGRAMLGVARAGWPARVLESADINRV